MNLPDGPRAAARAGQDISPGRKVCIVTETRRLVPPCGALGRLQAIRCFLFDMDGTINLGQELIPGMEGFLTSSRPRGGGFIS